MPRDAFVFKIQRELWHPKYARKASGLSRNRPQALNVYSLPCQSKFDFAYMIAQNAAQSLHMKSSLDAFLTSEIK